ncbi:MAG: TonB family protein, partial [Bacteroidales bacterium]|nr:TonB family protein [Bacteroidales bacterium]
CLALQAQTVVVPNEQNKDSNNPPIIGRFDAVASKPLILMKQITGKEVVLSDEEYDKIDRSRINTVEVLGDQASIQKYTELYGEKAQGGIVLITMKRPQELDEVVVVSFKDQNDEPDKFYLVYPETMPRFQGGDMSTFTQWLARRITHPCSHSGTVKVGFEVGTDGSVSDVKIMESVCEEIDAKVLSVVSQSPKWEPATDGGHPVAQYLTIPIVFRKDTKSK